MSTRDAIAFVKARIKALSAEQAAEKKMRRGCPDDLMSGLWIRVATRSDRITGALNLYHELRGSSHRHVSADPVRAASCEYYSEKLAEEIGVVA